ncbi:MAG: methionine synthase, partial [Chloroflexi bacterium]|nr:methionine synthase [Chloroflexota bacterium]
MPTAIGSMPHKDAAAACRQVLRYLPQIPTWPQLPMRASTEGQYAQFAEGFPGISIQEGHISVARSVDFDSQLERLYQAYLAGDSSCCPTGPEHAAGLHAFLAQDIKPPAVKGQITGPITWGLGLTQEDGRPAIYDDTLADA